MANITEIRETVKNMQHVFFTPESANDFRQTNRAEEIPTGSIKFAREMDFEFFTRKQAEFQVFGELPDDRELMRIISQIPGFDRA